ncbi:MAG TPA: ACT domain-containing protein [Candidatus Binatia bacterium]|nr:ACT domain-containing protein [Candidatus Binatia bacterium]
MSGHSLRLRLMPESFAICRLEPQAPVPAWLPRKGFTAVIRTAAELSIYSAEEAVPPEVQAARGWRAFELAGPFAFTETGIIASVVAPLAEAGISVSVVATYDTDYVFVSQSALEGAVAVLTAAGHHILGRE